MCIGGLIVQAGVVVVESGACPDLYVCVFVDPNLFRILLVLADRVSFGRVLGPTSEGTVSLCTLFEMLRAMSPLGTSTYCVKNLPPIWVFCIFAMSFDPFSFGSYLLALGLLANVWCMTLDASGNAAPLLVLFKIAKVSCWLA